MYKKPRILILNNLFSETPIKTEGEFFEQLFRELKKSKDSLILELDSTNKIITSKYDFYSRVYLLDGKYQERKVKV